MKWLNNQNLAVGDSGEDVLHSVGSLGEDVSEVLLGEGAFAAVGSDKGSESRSELAVELAEVVLIEDEKIVGFFLRGAWEGGVDSGDIFEDPVDPLGGAGNVLVRGGGVVVSQVEEGIGVLLELVQSLDGA